MDDGGPALFRLVRFWSRRWARGVAVDLGAGGTLAQHVLVVAAVDARHHDADDGAEDDAEVTVGDVAGQLGLDRSGASRMVAAATDHGYLERRPGRSDARQSAVALTSAGRVLLDESHRWQRARFRELTASWTDADRAAFAGYLERLAHDVGA